MGRLATAVLLALAVAALAAGAGGADVDGVASTDSAARTDDGTADKPRIHAVYPNPIAAGDAGEFVTLSVPDGTALGRYRLADGETPVSLPNATASGRVVLSTAPNRTDSLVDARVLPLGDIALANSGERLRLVRDAVTVDALEYADAPEGELRSRTTGTDRWRPLGATRLPVITAGQGTVRAFVLPDAPAVAVDHLSGAENRILLGAYTLTSARVADALVAARERNVTVRVLVDGNPVGGLPRREAALLDRLTRAGVDVRAVGGAYARYDFHHAKYAVADSEALVTTENWKPAGTGGASSRGWGVVSDQPRLVSALADTFRRDAGWRGAVPWQEFRSNASVTTVNASTGQYPRRFDPADVRVNRSRLLVAPDNAERAVVGLIDNATASLAVEQVTIGGRHSPFLRATLEAARRGVRVRILLSSAWYAREENRRLVDWLNRRADTESLPLTARLAEPDGRFEKIHAKGLVVDGDQVVLGSLNWNNNSARDNREVAVVLEGDAVGGYFGDVFDADWPSTSLLPIGYLVVIGLVALAVLLVTRRFRFGGGEPGFTDGEDGCLTEN